MTDPRQPEPPLLQAIHLTRRFGGLTAVNRVSVELDVGEVLAVIGTNGAGKSTLINLLSGEIGASGGSIRFDGQARRQRHADAAQDVAVAVIGVEVFDAQHQPASPR